ncbi:hypothetical protein BX659_103114 [Orenia metallireducens]|jgi:hypothetical protein|uniref:DUF2383 domain-containing protein n=1 Tax=Orenia metallireducens TaxID=1413210 RepID=A0A285FJI9_9FIRM|nr:hypothetical protein [Orenia metallireducens]PRX33587.1 hypothetical protein BX659_103114 [Orenia metallireducens]SNY11430.1 hypothetical protein SAMN06265827_102114 [Orenia metallireducens]
MQKISQEYVLAIFFTKALNKEKLLIEKYKAYYPNFKDQETKDMLKEFNKSAQKHVNIMKDKMIKLGIK